MDRQLANVAAGGGPGLLFDLPLGVHPLGFDAQQWPELFAAGMSTGAPPDAFFSGQDWSTPPLHPDADRQRGYEYFAGLLPQSDAPRGRREDRPHDVVPPAVLDPRGIGPG